MQVIEFSSRSVTDAAGKFWFVHIICGTKNAGMSDWQAAYLAFREGCTPGKLATALRELADRLDRMPNAALRGGEPVASDGLLADESKGDTR